jgi:excisionase family DNA binding protein
VTTTTADPAPAVSCSGQLGLFPLPDGALFDVPDRPRLRSVREVAALLGCGKDVVYALIKSGALTATKPGGHLRVSIPDLEAYVRSTTVNGDADQTPAGAGTPAGAREDDTA